MGVFGQRVKSLFQGPENNENSAIRTIVNKGKIDAIPYSLIEFIDEKEGIDDSGRAGTRSS